ncbi:MAG TPA: SPOR domain-containing protein [Blastocatellia bacterium]|nr:SPOR domain-containing protein [Blastocatellia bacterium]
MAMNNKQVIAIFVAGIALLLAIFLGGLLVVKQDTAANVDKSAQNKQQPPANTQPPDASADGEARFVVHVQAFGTLAKANELKEELKRTYLAAHVKEPTSQDPLYRVNIGPYNKTDAEKVASDLSAQGRKGLMIMPWKANEN